MRESTGTHDRSRNTLRKHPRARSTNYRHHLIMFAIIIVMKIFIITIHSVMQSFLRGFVTDNLGTETFNDGGGIGNEYQ